MVTALVVEDGSRKANSNTYASALTIFNYAADRGVSLQPVTSPPSPPYDEDAIAIMAFKAMDKLQAYVTRWQGCKASNAQALPWPRSYVVYQGYRVPSTEVPQPIVDAQCQLVLAINAGIVLQPNTDRSAGFVTRRKVGPIEREFSEAVELASSRLPQLPVVDALLNPFLSSGGFGLNTVRV